MHALHNIHAALTPGGAVANPGFFDQLYSYAWFVTFGISFLAYLFLMRSFRSPKETAAR